MIKRLTRWLLLVQLGLAALFLLWLEQAQALPTAANVLVALALILLLRVLIVLNNFRMAARCDRAEGSPAPPLPASQCLRLIAQEYAASMWSASWTMPFRTFQSRLTPHTCMLPVLLIHGYGCNSGYWHAMSQVLQAQGISHRAVDLEPVLGGMEEYLPQVAEAIARLRAETGQRHIVLLGHSMGGLVGRAYLTAFADEEVVRLITLGTPHQGTVLACAAPGRNAGQMRRHRQAGCRPSSPSAWLQALAARETAAQRRRLVSFYSTHDNIIAPRTACMLEGARNQALGAIGHVALALAPSVQAQIVAEIRDLSLLAAGSQEELAIP